MRFLLQLQSDSVIKVTFFERTIVALARFDAFPATVVTCFSDDGTNKADDHRQKPYHDTFAMFSLMPYNERIAYIKRFVEVCCAKMLRILFSTYLGGIDLKWTI